VWGDGTCSAYDRTTDPLGDKVKRGGVPTDFEPVAVVRCRDEVRRVPGEGRWQVRITERADVPGPELVDLLRGPSDTAPPGTICTAKGVITPYFQLVDAEGRALLPAVPRTACGTPWEEVTDLIGSLRYHTVAETRVSQVESETAVTVGCDDSWKDAAVIQDTRPAPATPAWPGQQGDIRVCVFTVTDGIGELDSGFRLTGREASALRAALDAAGPAAACDERHTRFAILTPANDVPNGAMATVELDGCLRVQRPDHTLGQLDGSVVAMLTR
jgi:hypothetical protein